MTERPYDSVMPTTVTDLRHGRRGGGWLPSGYVPLDERVRACPVCAGPMCAGQDVHAACEPAVLTLFDPDE